MIDKNDILNAVKHIVRHNSSPRRVQIMHPTREWFIILAVALVGVVVAAVFSFVTYMSYDMSEASQVEVVTPTVPYRAPVVEAALESYRSVAESYQSILTTISATTPVVTVEVGTSTAAEEDGLEVNATTTPELSEDSLVPSETTQVDSL